MRMELSPVDLKVEPERTMNGNKPCFRCAELNTGFYLTGMRVFVPGDTSTPFKYPESRRCLESMLLQQDCPLCRLICHALVAKLSTEKTIGSSGSNGDDDNVDSDDDELVGTSSSGGDTSYGSDDNSLDSDNFEGSDDHDELISADSSDGEVDFDDGDGDGYSDDDDKSISIRSNDDDNSFNYDSSSNDESSASGNSSDGNSGSYNGSSDDEDDGSIGTISSDDTSIDIFKDVSLDHRLQILQDYAEEEVILSYVRAGSLPKDGTRSSIRVMIHHLMQAENLLLRIQVSLMGLDITTWVHALALGPATFSEVPLTLHSKIRFGKGALRLDERLYDRGLREQRAELGNLLADLSARNFMAGRIVGETIDMCIVAEWIRLCDKHGNRCQPEPLFRTGKPIWMIDIKERRLISVPGLGLKFAALSYVWGGPNVPQLKYSSVNGISARLKSHGGLDEQNWDDIPHTISDSIFVCQELAIPYLWVDAICLDQDFAHPQADPDMPNPLDELMGLIYQSAYLTIVCAAGSDSWRGLPGARPQRARKTSLAGKTSLQEQVRDQWLGYYPGSSYYLLAGTKWNTRAWTYQEHLLSKRLLVFTDDEALYECDTGVGWRESIFGEHPDHPAKDFTLPLAQSNFKIQMDALILDAAAIEQDSDSDSKRESAHDMADSATAATQDAGVDSVLPVEKGTRPEGEGKNGEEDVHTRNNSLSPRQGTPASQYPSYREEFAADNRTSFSTQIISVAEEGQRDGERISWLNNANNLNTSASASPTPVPSPKAPKYDRRRVYELFTGLIHVYVGRQITNPADALLAVNGILRRVGNRTKYEFLDEGIPSDLFYDCLFFDVPHFRPALRREGFPSWSWSGWKNDAANAKSRRRTQTQRDGEKKREDLVESPIKFWSYNSLNWLNFRFPVYRPVVSRDEAPLSRSVTDNVEEDNGGNQDGGGDGSHGSPSQKGKETATTGPGPVVFDEILLPGMDKPIMGRGEYAFPPEWRSDLKNTLVCIADTLMVHISRNGEKIEDGKGRSNERRYHIISPDLGFPTIDLDREWRKSQSSILFMQVGKTAAFDAKKMRSGYAMPLSRDGKEVGKGKRRRLGWEDHLRSRVVVVLLEPDEYGLFRRAGMYEVDKEYWDVAPTKRTLVGLH